jgi:hypothetical protein
VEQCNLIVVKWGSLYTPEHVINLYECAKRLTKQPFNFIVFTDDTTGLPKDKNWRFIKLPEFNVAPNRGWWYKMEIFNRQHELSGKNLYIDLDTIIIKDLSVFWELMLTDGLYICRDFNRQFLPSCQLCNSSVMGWKNSAFDYVFKSFTDALQENMRKYRGDQDYIHAHAKSRIFWPDDLAMSWKWECWRGGKNGAGNYKSDKLQTVAKPDTCILVFHGKPKPEDCEDPKMISLWTNKA